MYFRGTCYSNIDCSEYRTLCKQTLNNYQPIPNFNIAGTCALEVPVNIRCENNKCVGDV